ncbi:beta-propeller fold lactonase family protein [Brenneria izadpanahii]|uniref:Beta-propeller fold lactonase family protein n=1 Tax=Brenneria izadpanahii TaxID=2722756 RepID=A0ABX7UVR0_9GAMM|nr:putative Ig domain-containing protein [Brenneria izadpanahii]QTF09884.1 beta-propeller fold lactonase family protein [Brenneria izadpanahii]
MTHSRSASRAAHRRRPQQAWALEPRMMFDAAAVATAEAVVAATDAAPGVTASGAEAAISVDESSAAQSVDLFSGVSVSTDAGGESLNSLVISVDSSGDNQALVIDGSTITLSAGSGTTTGNNYYYSVAVSGGATTVTVSIASSEANTAADVASLIDGIAYSAQDNTVESGAVTVTLSSLSDDGGETADLSSIRSTIVIQNDINVAPVLSDDHSLEAAESFTLDDLGDSATVVYSSNGGYAYVAGDDALSVFSVDDAGRLTLVETVAVDGVESIADVALSADGSSLYLIDGQTSNTYLFSVDADGSLSYTGSVSASDTTRNLAISADGAYVYVTTQYNGMTVFARDADTGALTQIQTLDEGSLGLSRAETVISAGGYVYVVGDPTSFVSYDSLTVLKINDDGTLSVIDTIQVNDVAFDSTNFSMAVSGDASLLYLGNASQGTLQVYRFDGGALTLVETLSADSLSGLALNNDGSVLYALSGTGALNVYSTSAAGNLTLVNSVTVAGGASDIAVFGDGLSLLISGNDGVARYTAAQTLDLGAALLFADGLTLTDGNYDGLNDGAGNYNGASIAVSASVDTGSFGFADGNGLTLANGVISLNGAAIATFSANGGALTVTFTADTTTAVANQLLQQLTYTNAVAAAGSFIQLTVTGSDAALTSNAATLTLRVNSAPQVNADAAAGYALSTATSETAYSFTLFSGLFGDEDGDAFTWSVSGLPDGLSFDAATRTISGSSSEAGAFTVTVTVTDAAGASASLDLELVVEQIANRAPEVNEDAAAALASATENSSYSATLDASLFSDPDGVYGDSLTWSVSGLPDGFSFDAATLTIFGTSGEAGDYALTVTVTDQSGASVSADVSLRVITQAEADNSAPALGAADSALVYTAEGALSGYGYYVGGISMSEDGATVVILGSTSVNFGGTAYISIYSRDTTTGELSLIQTFTQGTTDSADTAAVEVDGLSGSTAVSASADGRTIYVAGSTSDGGYVVQSFSYDGGAYQLTSTEAIDAKAVKIELSADGETLYVMTGSELYGYTVGGDGSLTEQSHFTDNFSSAIALAVSSDNTVYVLSSGGSVTVYAASSNGALSYAAQIDGVISSNNFASITAADNGYAYVVGGTNGGVAVVRYDSSDNSIEKTASYSVGGAWAVAVSADGSALYVGTQSGTLYVYSISDGSTLTQVRTVSVGRPITTLEVSADGSVIYSGARYYNTGLSSTSVANTIAVSYPEGGTINPAASLTLSDADYDALGGGAGNYNGAVITLTREGGADSADSYGFTDGNGLTLADGVLYLDGAAIATFANADGALTVTFTADVSSAVVNRALQQISYANASSDPGSSITLTLSVADQYVSSSVNLLLEVAVINNAPSLQASGQEVTYISGGGAVKLFDDVTISAGEADQSISGLTLTVSDLQDDGKEVLIIGGSYVTLSDGVSVSGSVSADVVESDGSISTVSYSVTISVSVTDGVASVTVSSGDGLSTALAAALVKDIAYINTSSDYSEDPTTGDRTITLISIQDNGGTSNDGVDTSALSISATVSVSLTNSAPSVSAVGAAAGYVENGDAAALFDDVVISSGEPGQTITNIVLTVSGLSDGESEALVIDGAAVSLTANASGETAGGYSYYISLEGDTATVYLYSSDGMSVSDATGLIAGLAYVNQSDDPTAGERIITLATLQDGGGTANGGVDTVSPAIAASVTVTGVNDAPVVTATAADASYATSGSSASLFNDVVISTVESGQTISSITFTVSGLLDGGSETLTVDGTRIALTDGGGTLSNGYAYSVTLDGDSAVVTISSDEGIAADAAANLIEQTSYANISNTQTAGVRTISLSVRDSGGQDNGGSDSAALETAAVIDVVNNSSPELSAGADYTSLEVAASLSAISGLADITASALTANGDYLYAASSDGGIAIFSRNAATGELTLLQTLDGGVSSVSLIEVSGDGGTVYMLGADGNSVTIFSRDLTDGSLTLAQTLSTENVVDLAISADGSALYVVDGNYSGLLVYTLDADSGQYALGQSITASTGSEPYLFTAIGVETAGDYVYVITDPVADTVANTLIVYQRAADGTLNAVAYLRDGAADGESVIDISSPVDIAVSSDGGTIYVASEDGVAAFAFVADGATLTYTGAVAGLSNVTAIALSSSGDTLYVTSSDGSISRYKSDGGLLTLIETLSSESTAALAGAQNVATGAHGAVVVIGSGGLVSFKDALTEIAIDYNEHGTVLLADLITLSDTDYDALADGAGNYNGAVITLTREDGANGDDSYSFADGNGLTLVDGALYLDGSAIATFINDGGTLTVTFTADVSTATANLALQQISYTNLSDDPGAAIRLSVTVTDAYAASASATLALNVTEINDAPVLTTTPANTQYVEGGEAAALFSGTAISTVEASQAVSALTLSVSGLSDGENETLIIDGASIALVAGSGVTSSGYAYSVSVSGGVATVVISSASGISAADASSLVNAIVYANASDDPTAGVRSVTLSAIQDDGGSANGGSDAAMPDITATVDVAAVNNAPALTATPADPGYAAGDDAVSLFDGAEVSTIEDGQSIAALTVTVSGVADSAESLIVDGVVVTLTDGAAFTTASGLSVTVALDDGVATLTIGGNGGISSAAAAALIDGLAYANTSAVVTSGERAVTLAAIRDDGGTANGGADTGNLNIISVVNIANSAPQATDSEAILPQATQAAAYRATLSSDLFSDINGDVLTWSVEGLPDGLSFDGATLTISGKTLAVGSFALTLTVNDGQGGTASRSLTMEINKQPVMPVVSVMPDIPGGMMDPWWELRQDELERQGEVMRPAPRGGAPLAASAPAAAVAPQSGDALSTSRYPLVNGEIEYADTPWRLDPIMETLMFPLEEVDFSPARSASAAATRADAQAGLRMPLADVPNGKAAFSAQLQQEQAGLDELLSALNQLTDNNATPER